MPSEALQSLLGICNRSYCEGTVPPQWKVARVVPIPKIGKQPSELSSWRPISLLSCTSKAMERVITDRLTWHLERNGHLNESQAGFRRGRSTTDNLLVLTTHIRAELAVKKGILLAVFFDVKGAFDSVWHEGLLLKLARAGVTGKMLRWLSDYLSGRGYYVQLGHTKSATTTTAGRGVPQGSTVSPVLFNVMMADLAPTLTKQRGIGVSIFADDIAVWYRGSHKANVCILAPEKTSLVPFTRRLAPQGGWQVQLGGITIQEASHVKFLGMTLDKGLTLNRHVRHHQGSLFIEAQFLAQPRKPRLWRQQGGKAAPI